MRNSLLLILLLLNLAVKGQENNKPMSDKFTLIIHGGAGTILKKNMTEEKEKAYREKLEEALGAGSAVLSKGGTSVDAIEATIKVMEDSPLFNAGKGSVFTNAGTNEMDASIMEGNTRNAGAVAGVTTIKHPISAARLVMEKSPHVMLAQEGAEKFAGDNGLEIVDPKYFRDEVRYEQWKKMKETEEQKLDHDSGGEGGDLYEEGSEIEFDVSLKDKKYGTVGAVAIDRHGNIAAATSTGGMTNKRWGRIGDSPIIAAGTYANNKTCGVSCTGHGEYFIRNVVAYDISALMEYKGMALEEAAKHVIHNKLEELGGKGGVICIDKDGNLAAVFNTPGMYRGWVREDGKMTVAMYKE